MKKSNKNKCKLNLLLTKAVLTNKVSHVRCLINRGADPFFKDIHERTLLHQAKSERMIRLLIKLGLDINAKDRDGRTAMEYAINYDRDDECFKDYNQYYMIKEFLKHKPDINEIDRSGRPLLYTAINSGCNFGNLIDLINHGADVNARTADGNTALHAAIESINSCSILDLVKIMLDRGADIYATNNIGITPLTLAANHPCISIMRLFMMYGNEINLTFIRGYNSLQWIIINSTCRLVDMRKILEHDFYRQLLNDQSNEKRHSLLHLVCSDSIGNINLAKLVIKCGADVNAKDRNMCTPLHLAVYNPDCDRKLVELLLDNGADINAKNVEGNTPLYCALRMIRIKYSIIKALIFRGANITVENNNFTTVLYGALKNQDLFENVFLEFLKFIYENDMDNCLYGGKSEKNPLSLCLELGNVKYAKILLKYMALKSFTTYKIFELLVQFLSFELVNMCRKIQEEFMKFFLECWEELRRMSTEYVTENITLLQIISFDIYNLTRSYIRGKNKGHLMAAVISRLNSEDYFIYNDLIMCLRKDNLLRTVEEMQIYCKTEIGPHKIILDQLSMYHLMKFCSKQDLINFIIAFSNNLYDLCNLKVPVTKSSQMEKVKCSDTVNITTYETDVRSFKNFVLEWYNVKGLFRY